MNPRELNFEGSSPLLYLIATPIGNLSKPFISCHEHNENEASAKIISLLKEGKKICYMSDAGYPTVSDPGQKLVAHCLEEGIKVSVVSGPSAAINALAISGLDTSHFYFEGFLPAKESEKSAELKDLASRKETIIFYESPHRIGKTLASMYQILGNRKATICRELTKTHEEAIRGSLEEFVSLDEATLRGEMVIVVEGCQTAKPELSEENILKALQEKLSQGMRTKDAVKEVSEELSVQKNRVYDLSLKLKR